MKDGGRAVGKNIQGQENSSGGDAGAQSTVAGCSFHNDSLMSTTVTSLHHSFQSRNQFLDIQPSALYIVDTNLNPDIVPGGDGFPNRG